VDREQIAREVWRIVDISGENAFRIADLIMAREQAAREPLLAQIAALHMASESVRNLIDAGWLVRNTEDDGKPGFALRQIEPLRLLSEWVKALEDVTSAARDHDEAVKRAAFEAGARAQREAQRPMIGSNGCLAALVSPPAQETG
jgi:hypothetical protein